jgi:hypothetical protein
MKAYMELKSGTVLETNDPTIWPEAKRLSAPDGRRRLMAESLATLREAIKPGDTVWTKVTHVSRSGMSRNVQAFIIKNNEPRNISGDVARVMDHTCNPDLSVKMGGCGMDMGGALVYSLSRVLFRDAFDCIGEGCPSNEHSNGDRNRKPHKHSDGGYALRQRWM